MYTMNKSEMIIINQVDKTVSLFCMKFPESNPVSGNGNGFVLCCHCKHNDYNRHDIHKSFPVEWIKQDVGKTLLSLSAYLKLLKAPFVLLEIWGRKSK